MAQKIPLGIGTYLIDFANNNALHGRGTPYTQYTTDLDTNFKTLRTTLDTVIDEVKAVQGPNATLGVDLLVFNDYTVHTPDPVVFGHIGLHSYQYTNNSTSIDISRGDYLLNGAKVTLTNTVTLTPSSGNGTYFIALDANGYPILSYAVGDTEIVDIYELTVAGGVITVVDRLTDIFFDGDEYENMRDRPAAGVTPVTFPALNFLQFNYRMEAVEAMLAGLTTDPEGNSLGQPAIRPGNATTPGLVIQGSTNTGIFGTTTSVSISTAGVSRVTVSSAGVALTVPFLVAGGTPGAPSYSFTGNTNCGMYSPGTNRVAFSTASTLRGEFDAEGNLDLPTNARVQGNEGTFRDLVHNTQDTLEFSDADTYDIGNGTDNWHDHTANPADETFTVPTGCDGTYHLLLEFEWEPATEAADLELYIMLNGNTIGTHDIARWKRTVVSGDECSGSFSTYAVLAASDDIEVDALITTGGANPNMGLDQYKLSIHKVA